MEKKLSKGRIKIITIIWATVAMNTRNAPMVFLWFLPTLPLLNNFHRFRPPFWVGPSSHEWDNHYGVIMANYLRELFNKKFTALTTPVNGSIHTDLETGQQKFSPWIDRR